MRLPDATGQIRQAPVRALRAVFSGVGQLLLAADRLREEDAKHDAEQGNEQQGTLATWDGRLSSSVRLLTPPGDYASDSRGAGPAPAATPELRGRKSGPRSGKSEPAGQARPAASARADRPRKAAKPATHAAKKPAAAKQATATKAAGGSRKSGRPKHAAEPTRFRSLDLTGNVRMLTDQDIADMTADEFERDTPRQPHDPVWSQAAPSWSSWSTDAEMPEVSPPLAEFAPAVPAAADLPISGYDELSLPSLRARLRHLDAAELADLLALERSHANR